MLLIDRSLQQSAHAVTLYRKLTCHDHQGLVDRPRYCAKHCGKIFHQANSHLGKATTPTITALGVVAWKQDH
eukprot:scaffold627_cov125-Cylindrotheca_fusiformis.AAC.29